MRFGDQGYPLVVLSHRKREFLETTLTSIKTHATGITDVIVVDDSGDPEHHEWLGQHDYQFSLSDPWGRNVGYLMAMNVVWEVAREAADEAGVDYVLLWEEDFTLTRPLDVNHMAFVMENHPELAHLNLQRQAVYRVERRYGYMESHQRRGYGLTRGLGPVPWVAREQPFTTNPGLIRREVLDIDWPTRYAADRVDGGAEPAMSRKLEEKGYHFGWLGRWDTPHTRHVAVERKTGIGY